MLRTALASVEPVTVQGGVSLSAAVCIRKGSTINAAYSGDIDVRVALAESRKWRSSQKDPPPERQDENGDLSELSTQLSNGDALVIASTNVYDDFPTDEVLPIVLSSTADTVATAVQNRASQESPQIPKVFMVAQFARETRSVLVRPSRNETSIVSIPRRLVIPAALVIILAVVVFLARSGIVGWGKGEGGRSKRTVAEQHVLSAPPDGGSPPTPPSKSGHAESVSTSDRTVATAEPDRLDEPQELSEKHREPLGEPGERLWRVRIGGSNFASSPSVGGKKVYVGSKDSHFYCLATENGEILWKFKTGGGIGSSPFLLGARVYFGSYDSTLYCLNRHAGSLEWRQKVGDRIVSSPIVHENVVYCGSNDSRVYAWNSGDGALQWSHQTGGRVWARPLAIGRSIVVGSLDKVMYCLDARTGAVLWSLETDGSIYTAAAPAAENSVVFGTNSGTLYRVDAATGNTIWKRSFSPIYSSPLISNDQLFFGCRDGEFFCLSLEDAATRWSYSTGADIRSSPWSSGETVYVGSYDGKMYAFSKDKGRRKWSYDTNSKIYATPYGVDGRLFFGDMTGWFTAVAISP
jgi:outer membrane protein assembly factor BamB